MLDRIQSKWVVVAGGAVVGVGLCLYLGGGRLARAVREAHFRRMRHVATSPHRKVLLVYRESLWEAILPRLHREARHLGAVGLDCEWVQAEGRRRAVAVLQLASYAGTCVLLRLSHLPTLPQSLKDFLQDESILKVGVGTLEDSSYLANDHNLIVRGCVDLRHLAQQCPDQNEAGSTGLGLSSLAQSYLGVALDKDWRVRASDWEASTLTPRQIKYAANDALVGIQLLVALTAQLHLARECSGGYGSASSLLSLLLPSHLWHRHLASVLRDTARPFIDLRFSSKPSQIQQGGVAVPAVVKVKEVREAPRRKGPLYHNCQLLAPDDQPLCTLDPKKARWYVNKGLGVLMSEDPLVVKLKFEPAGRPQAESGDGAFYLQSRRNVCVVCGHDGSYTRKSIVPHEYRRHFPRLLKHHQNHDVVLLCFPCHRASNMADNILRVQLGEEFGAPVSTDPKAKASIDGPRKAVRDAARALLKPPGTLPAHRHAHFLSTLQDFYPGQELTQDLLEETANMEVKVYPEGHIPHGLGVYQAYTKTGLTKLERRWRKHFLDTMRPQFMPQCWSVSHNTYKLKLKMARLPLDHPDRLIYKMALVGTEGTIEVPYDPNVGRKPRLDGGRMILSASPENSRDSTPDDSSSDDSIPDDSIQDNSAPHPLSDSTPCPVIDSTPDDSTPCPFSDSAPGDSTLCPLSDSTLYDSASNDSALNDSFTDSTPCLSTHLRIEGDIKEPSNSFSPLSPDQVSVVRVGTCVEFNSKDRVIDSDIEQPLSSPVAHQEVESGIDQPSVSLPLQSTDLVGTEGSEACQMISNDGCVYEPAQDSFPASPEHTGMNERVLLTYTEAKSIYQSDSDVVVEEEEDSS